MPKSPEKTAGPPSAFRALGLAKTVEAVGEEIRELYLADVVPWVVGYSGGKDSSATLRGREFFAALLVPASDRPGVASGIRDLNTANRMGQFSSDPFIIANRSS